MILWSILLQIFNHYVKIIVTFTIGPGPAQARES